MKLAVFLNIGAILLAGKLFAHEFWIDPLEYMVPSGGEIRADLRVGTEFRGAPMVYLPRDFTRFEIADANGLRPVEGRFGDRPAAHVAGVADGLVVMIHESTPKLVTWSEWETFAAFAAHKDFGAAEARHNARGLPRSGFSEAYTRHVKALFAVGEGAGQDQRFGLSTEFVALENPYLDDVSDGFLLQLFDQDTPRAAVQVELFARSPEGEVTITLHRTNDQGEVNLPVMSGYAYFADAVVLDEITPQEDGPVWGTRWAGMSFMIP